MNIQEKATSVRIFMNKFLDGDIVLDYSNADLNDQVSKQGDILKDIIRYLDIKDSIRTDGDQNEFNDLVKKLLSFIITVRLEGLVLDLTKLPK